MDRTGDPDGIPCRRFGKTDRTCHGNRVLALHRLFSCTDSGRLFSCSSGRNSCGGDSPRNLRESVSFFAPAVMVVKAVPVASFIILVLVWVPSRNLSVVISFLMVFPILYTNVLDGILSTDPKLLEMADVFALPHAVRIRYIYVSQVLPFFRTGCSIGLGLCWKAGVAAEVIGIPDGSIGEKLYNAKVYLNTPDLFAWTVVIVLISLLFEKLFLAMVDGAVIRLERMR